MVGPYAGCSTKATEGRQTRLGTPPDAGHVLTNESSAAQRHALGGMALAHLRNPAPARCLTVPETLFGPNQCNTSSAGATLLSLAGRQALRMNAGRQAGRHAGRQALRTNAGRQTGRHAGGQALRTNAGRLALGTNAADDAPLVQLFLHRPGSCCLPAARAACRLPVQAGAVWLQGGG